MHDIYLLTAGITLSTIGKVLLGITVLSVHWHIYKEHKIDRDVLRSLRKERTIALLGIAFIVVGWVLEMIFYLAGPAVLI